MSIILNALRKSEQERQSNPTETLEDKIQVKQEPGRTKKMGWVMPLIIVNCLLLGFFLWQFMKPEEEAMDTAIVNTVEKTKEFPIQTVEKTPEPITQPKLTKPQVSIAQQIKKIEEKRKQPIKQQAKLITPLKIQTSKVDLPPAQTTRTNKVEPKATPPKIVPVERDNKNTPPFLAEMSYSFRQSIPRLNINVYVYSEEPNDRFIMVDMQKYQEGAEIDKDMVLNEIRPNSIVIEYRGEAFQIQR